LHCGLNKQGQDATHATHRLPALQARDRGRTQVGGGLHVRADRRCKAAAEVGSAKDLFLSAVRGVAGDGAAAGGRAEHGGLGYDPRPGELGAFAESCGMGELARGGGAAGIGLQLAKDMGLTAARSCGEKAVKDQSAVL